MEQATDWKRMLASARKALVKSLNDFGCNATLDLVVRLSAQDMVANELLCLYPKVVSMGEFLARIPVIHMSEIKRAKRERNRKREVR